MINAHPDLKGIWAITSVSLPGAAKAVRDAGKADQIFVTGLSLPNTMRQYVEDGTVRQFVLWSPVDLGYLTVHVAKLLHDKKLDRWRAHDSAAWSTSRSPPAKYCSVRRKFSIARTSASTIFELRAVRDVHQLPDN